MVLGFKGVYFITAVVVFTTEHKADAAHPHGPLLDATAHIITLPGVLRATLYGGVVILLSSVSPLSPPALSLRLKASCLLFHSPMCLPQELPHFNINRMLHHAVAQTCPCCIAAEVLLAVGRSMLGKKVTMFWVFGFKRPPWFVWVGVGA